MVATSRIEHEHDEIAFAEDLKYLARRQRAKTIWQWYCRTSIAALLALTLYHII